MTSVMNGEVLDLRRNFDVQEGGIVSRIVLKQASGSVTAFAFDAGQELSEHTCPYDALVYVVDGEGIITVGGTAHRLSVGQLVKLPAHVPHAVQAPQPFKMLLTMLSAKGQA